MGFKNWTRLGMQPGEVGSLKNLLTKCEIVRGTTYFSITSLHEVPSLELQLLLVYSIIYLMQWGFMCLDVGTSHYVV
jgi:hypothetical protein